MVEITGCTGPISTSGFRLPNPCEKRKSCPIRLGFRPLYLPLLSGSYPRFGSYAMLAPPYVS